MDNVKEKLEQTVTKIENNATVISNENNTTDLNLLNTNEIENIDNYIKGGNYANEN